MTTRVRQADGTAPFISELLSILADGPSDLVDWTANGQAFIIWNAERFSDEILQYRSKSSNFASFVRQLNFYGFRKVNKTTKGHDPRVWEFQHFLFVRDRQDLICQIKRRTAQDNNQKNDAELLRSELTGVRSMNAALKDAVIQLYQAIVETAGEAAVAKLELNDAATEVIAQFTAASNPRKSRRQQRATSSRVGKGYESGRKRMRTESAAAYSTESMRTRLSAATHAAALRDAELDEDDDDDDTSEDVDVEDGNTAAAENITTTANTTPAAAGVITAHHQTELADDGDDDTVDGVDSDFSAESERVTTFEFGELQAAMPNLASSQIQTPPSQGLLSPIHTAMARAESTGAAAGFGDEGTDVKPPWLSRLPSFNGLVPETSTLTPTFGLGVNEQTFTSATAAPGVDEYFSVQHSDAEVPSAGLRDRFVWETELDSPSVSSLRPFLPSTAASANRHIAVNANASPDIQLLSDSQKQEVVTAMARMLFDHNSALTTIQRLIKSPAVQKAFAANAVSVDEKDPVTSMKKFIHVVRPDVVLACLVPLIPQIQQLITQISTQFTFASLTMATSLARSTSNSYFSATTAAATASEQTI